MLSLSLVEGSCSVRVQVEGLYEGQNSHHGPVVCPPADTQLHTDPGSCSEQVRCGSAVICSISSCKHTLELTDNCTALI